MTAPFQATKLFENNGTTADGWDDWDWVDNTNAVKSAQHQHQLPPPPAVFANNPMNTTAMHAPNFNNNNNNNIHGYHVPQPMTDMSAPAVTAAAVVDNSISPNNNGYFVPSNISNANAPSLNNVGLNTDQQNGGNDWAATPPAPLPPAAFGQPHQPQSFYNNNNNNIASNSTQYMQVESTEVAPPVPARSTPFRDNYRANSVEHVPPVGENRQTELPPAQSPSMVSFSNTLPPVMAPPSLDQMPFANTNPFKRVGTHTHRTPSPAAPLTASLPTTTVNQTQIFSSQPQTINPVQHAMPLQSSANRSPATYSPQTSLHSAVPSNYPNASFHSQLSGQVTEPTADASHSRSFPHQPDNLELAPHNDRNEYLQTGHLSEEGNNAASGHHQAPLDTNNDHLPPPGLSRLVLGEPEASRVAVQSQDTINHPVLDRMIPGTDLNYSTNLNLERQADGQDTDESSTPMWPATTMSAHQSSENQVYVPTGSESGNDRNLYLVAGESTDDNIQRVVTGIENVENQEVPIVEQQRELELDGENLDDNFQPNRANIPSTTVREREEPIDGGNTTDVIVQATSVQSPPSTGNLAPNLAVTQSDSVEDLDSGTNYNQKYNSNPSTGNDESDKEKSYYNRKGANSRRGEERSKRRGTDDKHDKHHDKRYETEDTDYSVRGDRRRNRDGTRDKYDKSNDGGYDSNKERNDYRVGRGGNDKSDRSYRDRPSGRDKHYRDSSRDDEDRYDSRYRDRGGRYDTDASRHGPDDPRYDRSGRRRNDRDRDYGRYRDDRPDRQYRKDRERDDRDGRPHPGGFLRFIPGLDLSNKTLSLTSR